jgi:hemerythrin-like metal-binding protein
MRNRRKMPGWIYESLPYLYVVVGALVAVELDNFWGIFGGLALLSAGIMVGWIRWRHRKAPPPSLLTLIRDTAIPAVSRKTSLVRLVWGKEYECGITTIDAQHRRLFEMSNQLLNAILEKKPKLDVELLLDELINDIARHFTAEEALLAKTEHSLTPDHRESHRLLLARSREMAERYHKDKLKAAELYRVIAHDVVSGHILTEDLKDLSGIKYPIRGD